MDDQERIRFARQILQVLESSKQTTGVVLIGIMHLSTEFFAVQKKLNAIMNHLDLELCAEDETRTTDHREQWTAVVRAYNETAPFGHPPPPGESDPG